MKKNLKSCASLLLAFCFIFSMQVTIFAKAGDYVGTCKYSDVVTLINNYPIPSYNMNGYTFVAVEDLANYGFYIHWDGNSQTLCIMRYNTKQVNPIQTYRDNPLDVGKKRFDMVKTDVRLYIGWYGYEIECLGGIPGKTLVNVDNLAAFGLVEWHPNEKAVKIWIDGLHIQPAPYIYTASSQTTYTPPSNTVYYPIYATASYIESRIDGEFEGWDGETIFKLMNGQVWQQDSYSYYYHYSYMPKVIIYKSGARYKMKVDGTNREIYVKRIK